MGQNPRFHGGLPLVESTLTRLSGVFARISDPRGVRGVRHPFQGMVALVFLGLLARITEMAVLVRWATAHWEELQEPLGFTRNRPPCDTTISRSLARLSLAEFRIAEDVRLRLPISSQSEPARPAGCVENILCHSNTGSSDP